MQGLSDSGATTGPEPGSDAGFDLAQGVRLVTGVMMVVWGYAWWLVTDLKAAAPVMSLFCLAAGFATLAIAATPHPAEFRRRLDTAIFGAIFVMGIAWLAVETGAHPFATDEITIGQASSSALLSGVNPYNHDLLPWIQTFHVSPRVSTPTLDGGDVHSATYPALSFLVYVPIGLLRGQGTPYGQSANVISWAVTMVVLWWLVPRQIRLLVPVILSLSFFVDLVAGGNTDCIFVPFLCVALWRWNRYGDPEERSPARWIGPVMLGLACAVKQAPWLTAPFLVAAVAMEAHSQSRPWTTTAARYVGVASLAFLVPNLPFILLSPGPWLSGVLLPFTRPLIPFGQGLVQVIGTTGLGGGRLSLFTLAALSAEVAALLAFIALHPRSRRALPLLAVAPLALGTRSLPNYFTDILPALLVGAATVPWETRTVAHRIRRWAGRGALAAAVIAGLSAVVAVASPPPVHVRVLSAVTGEGPDHRAETTITLAVTSTAGRPIHPSFVTLIGVQWMPGWRIAAGPRDLGPGVTASYRLVSSDYRVAMAPAQGFAVGALVPDPASVSVSDPSAVTGAVGAGPSPPSDATVPAP